MSDDIRRLADEILWFHSIDLGDGVVTRGLKSLENLQLEASLAFHHPVAGLSVLDVGAWDGFFSFEARRRGAARVLASDHFCWSGPGWGTKRGFDLAKAALGAEIEEQDLDVTLIRPETLGRFDVVLFLGVLYHLKNPLAVLENLAQVTTQFLVVETHLDAEEIDRPAMIFYPNSELGNDPTNWWGPNVACVTTMLLSAGFHRIEFRRNPMVPQRGFFHAFKDESAPGVTGEVAVLDASTFDDAWYLNAYPDVAEAVRRGGFASGWEHFDRHGRLEGRGARLRLAAD